MNLFEMSHFNTGIQITPLSGAQIVYILLIFGVTGCITSLPLNTNGIGLLNLILMGATGLLLVFFMVRL